MVDQLDWDGVIARGDLHVVKRACNSPCHAELRGLQHNGSHVHAKELKAALDRVVIEETG